MISATGADRNGKGLRVKAVGIETTGIDAAGIESAGIDSADGRRSAAQAGYAASAVLSVPSAGSAAAAAHFAGRLAFETDVSDVHADLESGLLGRTFVLVDTRSAEAWEQGRIPGAIHLPTREIAARAADRTLDALIPPELVAVTYCWGPGCNGATRAALELARLGRPVKEMIGGFEYWVREGFAYDSASAPGSHVPDADPLTTVVRGAACGC
jgi:rhodanese-related sulfurtransferase